MMSMGWTWYVIALVALNIFGCVWLLWWTARRNPGDPKPEDTLHTWDGDPYTDEQIAQAASDVEGKTELDAVVAYLQDLGRHAPRGGQP